MTYDAAVVGLGAMGSATAYELARRGLRVLGLDARPPAHQLGSSGGLSRIIRLAYFEHSAYVPLLRTAWTGWHELEALSGDPLLLETGGLYAGSRSSAVLERSWLSARDHDLPHTLLDAEQVARRFPALRLDPDMAALYEPTAGILFPERCIQTHLRMACERGATLRFDEGVRSWTSDASGIRLTTDQGNYRTSQLVLAAGAWLGELVSELSLPLTVERNVQFWFDPAFSPELLVPDRLPVFIVEADSDHTFYGFPTLPNQGMKIARHHGGRTVNPETIDRTVMPDDEATVREFCARHLPAASGRRLDARVCMYTNTPDRHFILDTHPDTDRVIIASVCSGHGFKFSNVIGRICADLATQGGTRFDIEFLSLARFRQSDRAQ
jgi:sarcosine oxidase